MVNISKKKESILLSSRKGGSLKRKGRKNKQEKLNHEKVYTYLSSCE